jgi:aspartyl-tRNA(Asn)/glutamyl-tRNA(Gln) amidotransferase subunit B
VNAAEADRFPAAALEFSAVPRQNRDMSDAPVSIRAIVGLEIHVQLRTRTKMFCPCPLRHDAPPNTCVCPVCLGLPGALPVINRRAVEHTMLTGLALRCEMATITKWDRKSYFYPDLPKNYQISQFDLPLAGRGLFEFPVDGSTKSVRIRRAHLEEDAGKNLHEFPGATLVDLNRAGTPLLEIVTEPDIASADEACAFCVELQRLVTCLGVSEANMQKGQMRFEPNVNVAIRAGGHEFRTPICEIKNLNSFRSIRNAVVYEVARQVAAWKADHNYVLGSVPNENRGWDDDRGTTEFQRGKEAAHDYRYFPDPDLVPLNVSDELLTEVRGRLPELPVARRLRLVRHYGLTFKDAETIVEHLPTAERFEEVIAAGGPAEIVGKQFVNAWLKLANDRGLAVADLGPNAQHMAELARLTADGTINKTSANLIAEAMVGSSDSPLVLAKRLGLIQVRDASATEAWVDQAIAANEQAVRDALAHPKKAQAAAGFLRGQVMKLSGGKADPVKVGEIIDERLKSLRDNAME